MVIARKGTTLIGGSEWIILENDNTINLFMSSSGEELLRSMPFGNI